MFCSTKWRQIFNIWCFPQILNVFYWFLWKCNKKTCVEDPSTLKMKIYLLSLIQMRKKCYVWIPDWNIQDQNFIAKEPIKTNKNFTKCKLLLVHHHFDNNNRAVAVTDKYPGYCHCYWFWPIGEYCEYWFWPTALSLRRPSWVISNTQKQTLQLPWESCRSHPHAEFLKYDQLYFSRATECIFHHFTSIFLWKEGISVRRKAESSPTPTNKLDGNHVALIGPAWGSHQELHRRISLFFKKMVIYVPKRNGGQIFVGMAFLKIHVNKTTWSYVFMPLPWLRKKKGERTDYLLEVRVSGDAQDSVGCHAMRTHSRARW